MKKVSSQSIIGQKGANLIERIVLNMKYVWRPILIFDVGVDGDIEVCDPVTGEATNTIIRVQAKATTKAFQAETRDSFEYSCQQKDLDYWLHGNAPVILIVCRPDTNEAYWISIKEYFKDLSVQKTRKVLFNKRQHSFDENSARLLRQLAVPKDTGIYFSPLQKKEKLYTNLLEVTSFAPTIYVAETNYRKREEIWAKFKTMGVSPGPEWILTDKRILTFHDLDEPPFNAICDLGTREAFDTSEWSDTEYEDKKRDFVKLLNLCLNERTYIQGLRLNKVHKFYHFKATKNLQTRRVWYRSIKHRVSREVFKQYAKKSDPSQRGFCRHSAFKGSFVRYENKWYLEITPTYHFTSNGSDEDLFHEGRLSGIKRLERNSAVVGHLLMWADFLSKPVQSLFHAEYPFLHFGKLATVEVASGIPDDIWFQEEEDSEAQQLRSSDNQPRLLGL